MPAITFGTAGLKFGVTAESGVLVMSVRRTASSGSKEVMDEDGDIAAHGAYGFKADYAISAHTTGVTGLAGALIGSSTVLANGRSQNGITAGTYIVKSVDIDDSQEDFERVSVNVTQYPSI